MRARKYAKINSLDTAKTDNQLTIKQVRTLENHTTKCFFLINK